MALTFKNDFPMMPVDDVSTLFITSSNLARLVAASPFTPFIIESLP